VHEIIRKFVESGEIPKSRIDESFNRIMKLKYRLNHNPDETYRKELMQAHQEALASEKLVLEKTQENKALLEKAAEQGQSSKKSKKKK